MHTLMLVIESVLAAVGLWAVIQLVLYLSSHRQNERFLTTQKRLEDAAHTTVKEIQQVVAEDFKAARVDGRLKGDTATELRATAIKSISAQLGPLGMREVRKALGMPPKSSLDRVLVSRIEAAVFDLKQQTPEPSEIPKKPGGRFYPDTMRIARVEKTSVEEHPESLFDEPTETQRRPK